MRFVILLLSLLANEASAFTLLSGANQATLPVSPDQPEIVFKWDGSAPSIDGKDEFKSGRYVNLDDKEFMRELLNIAFDVWNNVGASYLQMHIEEDETATTDENDQVFSLVVKSSENLAAAAFAVPILNDAGNTIEDCDITVSDIDVTAKELAYTLVHEIGHCVGLGHNHTNYNAIMGYSRSSRSLSLGADDVAGIVYLYLHPDYEGEELEFLGCATVAGRESIPAMLVLLLIPLLAGVRRRSKIAVSK